MIDGFAILLTHMLLLIAFWRLRGRDDLDDEPTPGAPPLTPHPPLPPGFVAADPGR